MKNANVFIDIDLTLVDTGIRRCLMRRFPYGIYCRVEADEIRILVVKHHSRHPDYWKERVAE